ncbi:MAG: hypothetical protein A3J48_02615 [Candidatus Doudnabacteria bacterium RIFCSPHIGHO2_02_FULL_46_11]|uniref:Uncharacterized protein n=1 Tax=Candidatus Doudnabacteria bacterium RIFCSPHIGHO2_02_FULL_46_11 TaxID=1817832 RepID=A0A1F5P8W8_9BACT|nr:MAG: hypothetical protein A3J48_02615 [Candidatus Doudnabacteria bacterium RIFCSPHIGHO2_02_FULL_46_11]
MNARLASAYSRKPPRPRALCFQRDCWKPEDGLPGQFPAQGFALTTPDNEACRPGCFFYLFSPSLYG